MYYKFNPGLSPLQSCYGRQNIKDFEMQNKTFRENFHHNVERYSSNKECPSIGFRGGVVPLVGLYRPIPCYEFCEVFMWRHWCYFNTSTVWWITPYWNSIHAPSRHYFPQRYCAMPTLNVKLPLIGWFESASANGHRAYIEVLNWQKH
jgi:hypothetical protein